MNPDNRKKVLLINPPSEFKTPVLPLGLASIAAYLKSKDRTIDISVIDAWAEDLNFEELKQRIAETHADIAGVYMVSPRYDQGKKTIEACREALPKTTIIAGGPHPSAIPIETLNDIPQLDICVIGEGEITMHELVNGYQLSAIRGIAFREKNEIKITPPRDFIQNLDELPLPARELFPIIKYRTHPPYGRKNPYFTMVTSRGCPFQCAYCSKDVFSMKHRARSPQGVCDEIEELMRKYKAKEIQFYDDDFTLDMARAEKICDEILRRRIKIRWSCVTRVDLVNENLLKKMKAAGCWLISYGVESGNQDILNAIHKGFNLEQVILAFALTKKLGIATLGYFMAGLPGETKETIKQGINLAKKLKPDFASWGILIVYPGSSFAKDIQEGKYRGRLRTLGKEENIAGTFFGKGNHVVFEDNFTFEQLQEIIKKANREIYLRPRYLWQCLKSIRSLSDLGYYLNGGAEMLKSLLR